MQFFSDMFDFSICFSRPEAARDYTKKRLPARISWGVNSKNGTLPENGKVHMIRM